MPRQHEVHTRINSLKFLHVWSPLVLSLTFHLGLVAVLAVQQIAGSLEHGDHLVLTMDAEEVHEPLILFKPIEIEVEHQPEIEEVVEPHVNLSVQLDVLGGAAGNYASTNPRLVANSLSDRRDCDHAIHAWTQ